MKTWHIIAYRQYGIWSVTMPFETREKADRHAELYLRDNSHVINGVRTTNTNEHKKDITLIEIELPE